MKNKNEIKKISFSDLSSIYKKHQHVLHLLIIIALATIIYSNSFEAEFQLDDNHTILNNEQIKSFDSVTKIKSWSKPFFNRRIPKLTLAINYHLHGYDLFGYHLFNLIVHILNAFLVYWLILLIFNSGEIKKEPINKFKIPIALFASLIFAVHPIQIEAVTYITQRMVSLAVLFYLLSVCFYLKGRYSQIEKGNKFSFFFILSLISFIFGIYSKAIIFSLPVVLILIEIAFLRNENNKPSYKIITFLGLLILTAAGLIYFRYGLPHPSEAPSNYIYILTEFRVMITYIRLLFIPLNQHLYYDYPLSTSFFEWSTLLSLIFILVVLSAAILTFKKYRLISFSIFWFFISLLVESTLISLKFVIFEYRLYLAVVGYALFLTSFLFYSKSLIIKPKIIFVILIIFGYSVMTYQRNEVWKTGVSLWKDNVEKAPQHAIPYNHLGTYYFMNKDYKNALESYSKSISLDPNYAEPYNHRGILYKELGAYNNAISDLRKSLQINPNNQLTLNNIGYAYQGLNEIDSAIFYYRKAIALSPKYHTALNNLGIVLQVNKKYKEALSVVNKAISIKNDIAKYYNNRGNIYFAINELDSAYSDYSKTIELSPKYAKAYNNIGLVYLKRGDHKTAIENFTKAIYYSTDYADPYFNRGYALLKTGRNELALADFRKCLIINPDHQGTKVVLENINKTDSR